MTSTAAAFLASDAAAAITGGNPFRTTMISWKYVVPAFVVPFVFTLSPGGSGVLLQGSVVHIVSTSAAAVLGTAALSIGISGWLRRQATVGERCLLVAAAVLLFLPQTTARLAGVACATIAMLKQSRSV